MTRLDVPDTVALQPGQFSIAEQDRQGRFPLTLFHTLIYSFALVCQRVQAPEPFHLEIVPGLT
jgi:hypothetical protein